MKATIKTTALEGIVYATGADGRGIVNGTETFVRGFLAKWGYVVIGDCPECHGDGRIPNWSGCGNQAGGMAETCQDCKGTGRDDTYEAERRNEDRRGWARASDGEEYP